MGRAIYGSSSIHASNSLLTRAPDAILPWNICLPHPLGIVIGGGVKIGNNVTIYQGVTLGALNFPRDSEGKIIRDAKRHPTICDSVIIYAGATILGGSTEIGSRSVIGGNVWLTESVPPDSKVLIADSGLKIFHKKHHLDKNQ
ncbi:hypothetical protein EOM81_02085 [bacterium]|nr:hypothetical protein [bacterium]